METLKSFHGTELRTILHSKHLDIYQKMIIMTLIDARNCGTYWLFYDQIASTVGITAKCMREKMEPLISRHIIVRGKRGYYGLNEMPQIF